MQTHRFLKRAGIPHELRHLFVEICSKQLDTATAAARSAYETELAKLRSRYTAERKAAWNKCCQGAPNAKSRTEKRRDLEAEITADRTAFNAKLTAMRQEFDAQVRQRRAEFESQNPAIGATELPGWVDASSAVQARYNAERSALANTLRSTQLKAELEIWKEACIAARELVKRKRKYAQAVKRSASIKAAAEAAAIESGLPPAAPVAGKQKTDFAARMAQRPNKANQSEEE